MNSLKEYGELFEKLGLTELMVEEGNHKLVLKREARVAEVKSIPQDESQKETGKEDKAPVASTASASEAITAPLLGIYYPLGDKPFEVGDYVKKGDVVCNIEAMKMMNEVKAPFSGKIIGVLAKEGDLVEFGQKLFEVEEAS